MISHPARRDGCVPGPGPILTPIARGITSLGFTGPVVVCRRLFGPRDPRLWAFSGQYSPHRELHPSH